VIGGDARCEIAAGKDLASLDRRFASRCNSHRSRITASFRYLQLLHDCPRSFPTERILFLDACGFSYGLLHRSSTLFIGLCTEQCSATLYRAQLALILFSSAQRHFRSRSNLAPREYPRERIARCQRELVSNIAASFREHSAQSCAADDACVCCR